MSNPLAPLVLLVLILLGVPKVQGETFRVGFYNAPPLMIQTQNGGIYHDILTAIADRTNHHFEISYFPITRLQRLFELAKLDLEPGINPLWRQDSTEPGLYSIPFATLDQVLLFRPGRQIEVRTPEDLRGRLIGAIRGYIYPGFMDGFKRGIYQRLDVTDEPQLLSLLEKGRVDQVFIDRVVLNYWQKLKPETVAYQVSPTLAGLEIMMRIHPSQAAHLDGLNQVLAALMTEGVIEEIFSRYQ
ncbi:ABC transporter substrate-binding protein [Motiliproteus sp. MSK22-1]|uniref:substrate-binding periplasmic protein n=1 Tax=Motiliproteus sp. MSK22-1 TaxID=1897630 RepID=UPI0009786D50|nr:transporter substrate-binding domain-containing protein [Motiliproteus sp. MSK22-1]OMH37971.1 hypothetical protein BGP75_06700 [Motiliproteus sp. MSK22-1]